MLRIIQDRNLCNDRGVDGMYLIDAQLIVVADKNDKGVLVHEISHYLYSIGSTKYFDSILDICALLDIDFLNVVDVTEVSEIVDDYEVLIDELCAYFMEQVYKDFPELVLDSVPVYRIVLERGDFPMNEIINCGRNSNGKQVYGLKIDGVVVLTSVNRARIFSACFNLEYSNK